MSTYSPHLALATGVFEIAVAIWALRGPGRRRLVVPMALILLFLGGYQLAEVFVCASPGESWRARLAFADVIWLPPLGVWLVRELAAPANALLRRVAKGGLVVAGALTLWVALDPVAVTGTVCHAMIASYRNPSTIYTLYAAFYQLGLLGILVGAALGMVRSDDRSVRAHLADFQLGTLGFVVPSLLTLVLFPKLQGSMPSVMCHYALTLGLFLARMTARERRWAQQEQGAATAEARNMATAN